MGKNAAPVCLHPVALQSQLSGIFHNWRDAFVAQVAGSCNNNRL